jgi:hypothetical protein
MMPCYLYTQATEYFGNTVVLKNKGNIEMKKFKIEMTFWLTLGVKPSEVISADGSDVAKDIEEQFLDPDPYFDSGNFKQFGVGKTKLEHNCTKLGADEDHYSRQLDIKITGDVEDADGLLQYLVDSDILEDASDLGTFAPRDFWFNYLEDCDAVLHPVTDDSLTDDAVKNDMDGSLEIYD